ncbi:cellulase family glycosylhydrolase [Sphingomonas sp. MMS24-JH45]
MKPYHQQVIAAIRRNDPDALVAGTANWSQDVDIAARDLLPFGNVAYTLHYYANQPQHQAPLMAKATEALARVPLFVTEQGYVDASGDGPINVDWSRRWWDFLNARHISHLNWAIGTKVEGASALRPGASPAGGFDARERTPSGDLLYRYLRGWNHRQR